MIEVLKMCDYTSDLVGFGSQAQADTPGQRELYHNKALLEISPENVRSGDSKHH